MIAHYSILSFLVRPEIQEKVSVGLLMFDEQKVFFAYSPKKLKAAKHLLSAPSLQLLTKILHNIENKINGSEAIYSTRYGFKVFHNCSIDRTFTHSYIDYMSRYSNNLLEYSKPKEVLLSLKEENFNILFRKYVDISTEPIVERKNLKPFDAIKTRFGDQISEHYATHVEITHDQVQNLIAPVRIDFSGRNEIDVYAHTIDMQATPTTITHHINSFVQLVATYKQNKVPMKDFVIAEEPAKEEQPKQHELWLQLRRSKLLNYLDLSESEKIIDYAEEHGVVPKPGIYK